MPLMLSWFLSNHHPPKLIIYKLKRQHSSLRGGNYQPITRVLEELLSTSYQTWAIYFWLIYLCHHKCSTELLGIGLHWYWIIARALLTSGRFLTLQSEVRAKCIIVNNKIGVIITCQSDIEIASPTQEMLTGFWCKIKELVWPCCANFGSQILHSIRTKIHP